MRGSGTGSKSEHSRWTEVGGVFSYIKLTLLVNIVNGSWGFTKINQFRQHVLAKDRFLGTTNVVSIVFVAKSDISGSERNLI